MEAKGGILDEIEEFGQGKHSQSTFQYGLDLMGIFCFFRTTIVKVNENECGGCSGGSTGPQPDCRLLLGFGAKWMK